MKPRAHRRRAFAAAWVVAIGTVAVAAFGAWSTDSSCSALNAPRGLSDYADWWQGCASYEQSGGWPRLSGSPPACQPRRWTTETGSCVALSCVPGAELLAPCAGVKPLSDNRLDAVRLDERGCSAIVATAKGLRTEDVPASKLACSRVVRAIGSRLPSDDIHKVPYDFWPRAPAY